MHWGLLAQKDHKDVNFTSLRLLLVADGANPCKYAIIYVAEIVGCTVCKYIFGE